MTISPTRSGRRLATCTLPSISGASAIAAALGDRRSDLVDDDLLTRADLAS